MYKKIAWFLSRILFWGIFIGIAIKDLFVELLIYCLFLVVFIVLFPFFIVIHLSPNIQFWVAMFLFDVHSLIISTLRMAYMRADYPDGWMTKKEILCVIKKHMHAHHLAFLIPICFLTMLKKLIDKCIVEEKFVSVECVADKGPFSIMMNVRLSEETHFIISEDHVIAYRLIDKNYTMKRPEQKKREKAKDKGVPDFA